MVNMFSVQTAYRVVNVPASLNQSLESVAPNVLQVSINDTTNNATGSARPMNCESQK